MHFELEEWQSRYETTVEYNLADSGCHPVHVSELVTDSASVDKLLALNLHYPPVGTQSTFHRRAMAHRTLSLLILLAPRVSLGTMAYAITAPLIYSHGLPKGSLAAHPHSLDDFSKGPVVQAAQTRCACCVQDGMALRRRMFW